MRMGGAQPLMQLSRDSSTNQRVLFDISTCGRYVATPHHGIGGTNSIRVFDLVSGQLETEVALPKHAFPNAVALYAAAAPPQALASHTGRHPCAPMLAVSTGQRLYKLPGGSSGDDSDTSSGSQSEGSSGSQETELEAALLLFRGSFNPAPCWHSGSANAADE
jgi:hypothetical protein